MVNLAVNVSSLIMINFLSILMDGSIIYASSYLLLRTYNLSPSINNTDNVVKYLQQIGTKPTNRLLRMWYSAHPFNPTDIAKSILE